ncbi:hypothetical protein POX_f07580 [Penicillium oxalicum]|uniref:hypothetical protein n=1 Tax=Penicillium oxalicum TaxID=69781 RepID=UPI0020B65727|nr:hypothetical protein POX_f07580 [Penicillium oxalicum]KAI2787217.1 hypothetical protein POX_f07580 [Penicillium oxalicum]
MKIILEDQFENSDEMGQTVTASPGDVFSFFKGAGISLITDGFGLVFYRGVLSPPSMVWEYLVQKSLRHSQGEKDIKNL